MMGYNSDRVILCTFIILYIDIAVLGLIVLAGAP